MMAIEYIVEMMMLTMAGVLHRSSIFAPYHSPSLLRQQPVAKMNEQVNA